MLETHSLNISRRISLVCFVSPGFHVTKDTPFFIFWKIVTIWRYFLTKDHDLNFYKRLWIRCFSYKLLVITMLSNTDERLKNTLEVNRKKISFAVFCYQIQNLYRLNQLIHNNNYNLRIVLNFHTSKHTTRTVRIHKCFLLSNVSKRESRIQQCKYSNKLISRDKFKCNVGSRKLPKKWKQTRKVSYNNFSSQSAKCATLITHMSHWYIGSSWLSFSPYLFVFKVFYTKIDV